MQFDLAFPDQPDGPPKPSPAAPSTAAWHQLDEASRLAATEILARLIASLLTAETKREMDDE